MIPKTIVDDIIEAAQVVDVVGEFVALKQKGSNHVGCCPFHDEKTPSFSVSASKGIYKCFGCGKSGNAVGFLMEHQKHSYPEALRWLAKKYHIEIPERQMTTDEQAAHDKAESCYAVLAFAAQYYEGQLRMPESQPALEYIVERGLASNPLSHPDASIFGLGYAPAGWDTFTQHALTNGYTEQVLQDAGLSKQSSKGNLIDVYRDRVMFPIHTATGRVAGFGGRVYKPEQHKEPKYINSADGPVYDKSKMLYGLSQARKAIKQHDECYLVEGYTDVIAMHQHGVENVVAGCGTSLTSGQLELLGRYTKNVCFVFDGDGAGIKASLRAINIALQQGFAVKVVPLADGQDPDSLAQEMGPEPLQQMLKDEAKDFLMYQAELLLPAAKGKPQKLAEVAQELMAAVALIPDRLQRTFYVKECANTLGVAAETLTEYLYKAMNSAPPSQKQPVAENPKLHIDGAGVPRIGNDEYDAAMLVLDTPFHRYCYQAKISQEHLHKWSVGGQKDQTRFFLLTKDGAIANMRKGRFDDRGQVKGRLTQMPNPKNGALGKYEMPFYGLPHDEPESKGICLVSDEPQAVFGAYFQPKYTWLSYSGQKGLSDAKIDYIQSRANVLVVRHANPEFTSHAERVLAKRKVPYRLVNMWAEEQPNDSRTIIDYILEHGRLEVGLNIIEPDYDVEDTFLQSLSDEQRTSYISYRFYEDRKCYMVRSGDHAVEASDFTLEPLAFVLGEENLRLFSITGKIGWAHQKVVAFEKGELTSIAMFKTKIEDIGPYIWKKGQRELDMVKSAWNYKLSNLTAHNIDYLGWQHRGFWAWSNGIATTDGRFIETDENGMASLEGASYFIPAMSQAFMPDPNKPDQDDIYANDRMFKFRTGGNYSFKEWAHEFYKIFGEHGMVGLSHMLAGIFRDVINNQEKMNIPLLFSYGRPQSGKSTMTESIRKVFLEDTKPVDLKSSSESAFYKAPCLFTNGYCHFEEYRADLDDTKRNGIKNFWDGVSRTVSHMTRKAKTSTMKVRMPIAITGERLPVENGEFTRCVTLVFDHVDYSQADKERLTTYQKRCDKGVSNLVTEVIAHRAHFEKNFLAGYRQAIKVIDAKSGLKGEKQGRVNTSYAILLGTFYCLQNVLSMPFKYAEFEKVMIKNLGKQLDMLKNSSETGEFWNMLQLLIATGVVVEEIDYLIMPGMAHIQGEVRKKGESHTIEFAKPTTVLALRFNKVHGLYAREHRSQKGKVGMTQQVLKDYLSNDDAYLGAHKAMTFPSGKRTSCYLFNYDKLSERGIDLEAPPQMHHGTATESYDQKKARMQSESGDESGFDSARPPRGFAPDDESDKRPPF